MSYIREEYDKFVKENGHEPRYASVSIKYNDEDSYFGGIIKMSSDTDEKDELIFFYSNGIGDIESLSEENNGEDFVIEPDYVDFLDEL